jgi:hypothetical protein
VGQCVGYTAVAGASEHMQDVESDLEAALLDRQGHKGGLVAGSVVSGAEAVKEEWSHTGGYCFFEEHGNAHFEPG